MNCRCPYCGKKISYLTAMKIRRRGEYYCKKCKKESNVHIKKTIWIFFISMVVVALIILGYYLFMTNRENIIFVFIIMIPFLIFYLFAPMFVKLRPKKKFQDSLYDTDVVGNYADPDPTMASSAKVAPAFIDDAMLEDREYRPTINSDIFNAIKEDRRVVVEADGGTKHFDKFENISSSGNDDIDGTKLVGNIKNISGSSSSDKYVKRF